MGITKEAAQRAREKNILKDGDIVKPKEAKPKNPPPKSRWLNKFALCFDTQEPPNSPKPPAQPFGGAMKRKKEQPLIVYVAPFVEEEETESDEAVKEVKKSATTSRVVKKPSGEE